MLVHIKRLLTLLVGTLGCSVVDSMVGDGVMKLLVELSPGLGVSNGNTPKLK